MIKERIIRIADFAICISILMGILRILLRVPFYGLK